VTPLRPIRDEAEALGAAPLGDDEGGFWVQAQLSAEALAHLGALLAPRPDAWLSLGVHGMADLACLVHLPGLRRLVVTSLRLRSWAGIEHVADSLEHLGMGDTTLRPVSIAPLGGLRRLRSLGLNGPVRHPETIAVLTEIEDLSLRSITLPDLASLRPMRSLRSLWIGLGGTADLGLLPELAPLESLELWRIRGLHDVGVVGALSTVRTLRLQSMSAVTSLPSLAGATSLRTLTLDTMKGITDLAPIADAPALEELNLIDMPQLEVEALRPLLGHPTLHRGRWGLGSTRKNIAAFELLPLGDPPYGYPTRSS
jgi:hypothetical protein